MSSRICWCLNCPVRLKHLHYGPGLNEQVSIIDFVDNNALYYYHYNGLGSVIAISNNYGVVVEQYQYDVYGNTVITAPSHEQLAESKYANPYMFTGRRLDTETGRTIVLKQKGAVARPSWPCLHGLEARATQKGVLAGNLSPSAADIHYFHPLLRLDDVNL